MYRHPVSDQSSRVCLAGWKPIGTWVYGTDVFPKPQSAMAVPGKEDIVMLEWRDYLTSDPAICHGQLCAKGTRVFVTNILDSIAEGATRDQIMMSYPSLKLEHIDAALAYAAELAHEESLLPLMGE